MSDCGLGASISFADTLAAFGLGFVATRGFTCFVADLALGLAAAFDFGAVFDFGAADFGFALDLADFALAEAVLVFGFGADLGFAADLRFGADLGLRAAALPVRAGLAAVLRLFELFAMILASNSLSAASAFNPRGVLATALNTFQVFLPSPLPCGVAPC